MKRNVFIPIAFVLLMWIVFILQLAMKQDLSNFGIHPRDIHSLLGILTSPLIHGNWAHLLSNTLPLLILGILLFIIYDKIAVKVWILNYALTGTLVWIFARDSAHYGVMGSVATYHIGASGLIYGLASFLLFSGFFRMDIRSIAIACGVAIFYGGMVWGILPMQPKGEEYSVSWESHLLGGIVGLVLAYFFRNKYRDLLVEEHEKEITNRKTFDDFLRS